MRSYFTFPGTALRVARIGYGTMQLAGPGVWGPPRNEEQARALLRDAVAMGVNHFDTSDYYGPHHTNRILREALAPYADSLVIVSKVGAWRGDDGGWNLRRDAGFLRQSVEDNLRNLGLQQMQIVNLRMGGPQDDIATPMKAMRQMQEEGLIAHIGISTVSARQLQQARDIARIVCVQNMYNLAHRADDAMIDALAQDGIAYVPYFPLGGFNQLQSRTLSAVATDAGISVQQTALAWLLARSPNILVIAGTTNPVHLRANIEAENVQLSSKQKALLDGLTG